MLRDYIYTLDTTLLKESFPRFDLTMPKGRGSVVLVEFRILSPDSFIWRFLIGESVYYLYAEDFVAGLDYVKAKILHAADRKMRIEFVRTREPKDFYESTPYVAASTYQPPKDENEMMKFAIDSGYDFVFLCKSNESIDDVFFNNYREG